MEMRYIDCVRDTLGVFAGFDGGGEVAGNVSHHTSMTMLCSSSCAMAMPEHFAPCYIMLLSLYRVVCAQL
jgi:hypothetical protein